MEQSPLLFVIVSTSYVLHFAPVWISIETIPCLGFCPVGEFEGGIEMKHLFRGGSDPEQPTLLLLHGTGGNEEDLLPLAKMLSPESGMLSVRGDVLENGMPRFFRRLVAVGYSNGANIAATVVFSTAKNLMDHGFSFCITR
jgi:hypothetical protein